MSNLFIDYAVFGLLIFATLVFNIYSSLSGPKEKTKADYVFATGRSISIWAMLISIARGFLGVRVFLVKMTSNEPNVTKMYNKCFLYGWKQLKQKIIRMGIRLMKLFTKIETLFVFHLNVGQLMNEILTLATTSNMAIIHLKMLNL
ncbi:hypothetical protein PGB90_002448 [Kerria lacca]